MESSTKIYLQTINLQSKEVPPEPISEQISVDATETHMIRNNQLQPNSTNDYVLHIYSRVHVHVHIYRLWPINI